jgi:uncharacterized DUF497 family protein
MNLDIFTAAPHHWCRRGRSFSSCFRICKSVLIIDEIRRFRLDSGNLPRCLGHGVSLAEIEALFRGDVYIVRDAVVDGEQRILGFGNGAGRWIFCVFTRRGDRIRPVSVRFMHDKEVKRYVEEISRLEER